MNVDREGRDRLVAVIEQYLDEQTTTPQFVDGISQVRNSTDDPTVDHMAEELCFDYYVCEDHKVALSKEGWDYFQRLILVLKSDAHIEETRTCRWSVTQPIAAISLLLFGLSIAWLGFPYYLFLIAPLYAVSVLLWHWDGRPVTCASTMDFALVPFASVAELLNVRRRTVRFAKRKYPVRLKSKGTRWPTSMLDAMTLVVAYVGWLALTPLILLLQLLPVIKRGFRVVAS